MDRRQLGRADVASILRRVQKHAHTLSAPGRSSYFRKTGTMTDAILARKDSVFQWDGTVGLSGRPVFS
jgi:hypothetical protein